MTKYSTGGGGDAGGGDACELCGAPSDDLRTATVAGAKLSVCPDCAPHGETDDRGAGESGSSGGGDAGSDADRRRRAAQNTARAMDASRGDGDYWVEEGTDYERDRLPYLVDDYGERAESARQAAGLQREELAAELDVDESDLLAVEQGRATQADVGGSVVRAVEERLDVELAEE